MGITTSRLWMVTGPRDAGKTKFCQIVSEKAHKEGWDIAGLLSPGIFDQGKKTGILAKDLRTGKERTLAHVNSVSSFDLKLGRWFFDQTAIEWGNHVLETSFPRDLFIVDELGPLEFLDGTGWNSALPVLRNSHYRIGLVIIRPELQEVACKMLPIIGTIPLENSCSPEAEAQVWWQKLSKY